MAYDAHPLPEKPRVGEPELAMVPGMAAPAPAKPLASAGGPSATLMPDTSLSAPVALQEPPSWTYDFNPASGSARATFNGEVSFTSGGSVAAGVSSFNSRTGAVTLSLADITGAGGAPLASPALLGTPSAPTAAPGTVTTQLATTAFVATAIAASPAVSSFNGRQGAVTLSLADITGAGGAPLASPALVGSPTTPTAPANDQSSLIASTQFVANAIGAGAVTSWNGRRGSVTLTLSDVTSVGGAPIDSPNFTSVPTAATAAPGTATAQLATTAFVTNAITSATAGVASWNGRTGAVTLQLADITGAGGAPLTSPALLGTPSAPTASAGTATTQLATTAFVATAVAAVPAVSSFNGRQGAVTLQLADVTSVGGAPLASPNFTGAPTASPTPPPGDNSTRLATTAFIAAAFAAPSFTGTLALTGVVTDAPAAGTINDYSPAGLANASTLRINAAAAGVIITGIAGGFAGRRLLIMNIGQPIQLWAGAQGSAAANQFGPISGAAGASNGWSWSLGTGAACWAEYDGAGSVWRLEVSGIETLEAARTLYVNPTTGSDSNNSGFTTAQPLLTVQNAIKRAGVLNLNGQVLTIQCADGTYTGQVANISGPLIGQTAPSQFIISGNTTTPANVIFSNTGTSPTINATNNAMVWLRGITFVATLNQASHIVAQFGAYIETGVACVFGPCYAIFLAVSKGQIQAAADFTINGNCYSPFSAQAQGYVNIYGRTVTITGTPTWGAAFIATVSLGYAACGGCTFNGASTGQRYNAQTNSVIDSNGAGATYLPGSVAGTATTGGQYV